MNHRLLLMFKSTACFLMLALLLVSCSPLQQVFTYPKKGKYPKNTPYLYATSIKVVGGNFTNEERKNLEQRLYSQLDDSAKVNISEAAFVFKRLVEPAVFDTTAVLQSATNIKNYLLHLGYYRAIDSMAIDTMRWRFLRRDVQQRVRVQYIVNAGVPTLIDSFSFRLRDSNMQKIALGSINLSYIKKNKPVTKLDVLSEISRVVDSFKNNGYYRFTGAELSMRGDSSIAALSNVGGDLFSNLEALAEANEKRNKPSVKLALVLKPNADSSRIRKYYFNNIYIYPDFLGQDTSSEKYNEVKDSIGNIIRYYRQLMRNDFFSRYIFIKKGQQYRVDDFAKTISRFNRLGVWQNANIVLKENKDSLGLLDAHIQLTPAPKYGFEAKIEASYSANTNINNVSVANAGNLLGFSGNLSFQNRNVGKRGIKMTHALRASIELNLNAASGSQERINSNELNYTNTISIPKIIPAWAGFFKNKKTAAHQTFFNTSFTNTNRIGLFKLNSLGFNMGWETNLEKNKTFTFKPLNIEYSNLYDRTPEFDNTLLTNPFLRYSFNSAIVVSHQFGYNESHVSRKNPNRITTNRISFEAAILPLDQIDYFEKDLRKFVKLDFEKVINWKYNRHEYAFRIFGGVGCPIGSDDTTLPFFKQYFAGGPNSMRGWPIRGLGPGSKKPAAWEGRQFADRTGDIRFETNFEYRNTLAQIIPNTLTLKWAMFADVGNIWNFKNTLPGGGFDSTQFKFNLSDFYKELAVAAGAGIMFDFNYVLLRFDFGFRFKRPELQKNAGWKAPSIGFDDFLKKIFTSGKDNEYRIWRYENFNFSIGLNYAF